MKEFHQDETRLCTKPVELRTEGDKELTGVRVFTLADGPYQSSRNAHPNMRNLQDVAFLDNFSIFALRTHKISSSSSIFYKIFVESEESGLMRNAAHHHRRRPSGSFGSMLRPAPVLDMDTMPGKSNAWDNRKTMETP